MSSYELRAQEYDAHAETLQGWPVRIISYRIGGTFFASIESADPGAAIARAQGSTRAEATELARRKAAARLDQTRRMP
jgi:hypothetical protein